MKLTPEQSVEKREAIFAKYPELYAERKVKKSDGISRYPIVYGFECGPGWLDLIDSLSSTIQWHVNQSQKADPKFKQIKVLQCKEKFGQLRFVTNCNNDNFVTGAISVAEFLSVKICETCGAPGNIRKHSWMYVACDSCEEEKQKSRND